MKCENLRAVYTDPDTDAKCCVSISVISVPVLQQGVTETNGVNETPLEQVRVFSL